MALPCLTIACPFDNKAAQKLFNTTDIVVLLSEFLDLGDDAEGFMSGGHRLMLLPSRSMLPENRLKILHAPMMKMSTEKFVDCIRRRSEWMQRQLSATSVVSAAVAPPEWISGPHAPDVLRINATTIARDLTAWLHKHRADLSMNGTEVHSQLLSNLQYYVMLQVLNEIPIQQLVEVQRSLAQSLACIRGVCDIIELNVQHVRHKKLFTLVQEEGAVALEELNRMLSLAGELQQSVDEITKINLKKTQVEEKLLHTEEHLQPNEHAEEGSILLGDERFNRMKCITELKNIRTFFQTIHFTF